MHFEFVADRVEAIPVVARWHYDEWGHLIAGSSLEQTCATISQWCNRDCAPLMILAVAGNSIIGTAALKPHEMFSVFPKFEPWLGSVFVCPDHRNRGIAAQLSLKIVEIAGSIGAERLFLQTVRLDGGLYARLGWRPTEQINYRGHQVLVMAKHLVPVNSGKSRRSPHNFRIR